jgi:YD repeat-containing protein
MRRHFLLRLLGVAVSVLISPRRAQQADELGDVLVNLTPRLVWGAGANGTKVDVFCYARTGAQWADVVATGGSSYTDLPQQSVRMVPGATYAVVFNVKQSYVDGATGYRLTAHAPPGYTVQMKAGTQFPFSPATQYDGSFTVNGAQTYVVQMEIRVVAAGADPGVGPGSATSLRPAWTPWQLSLGTLRSGLPAGTLYFSLRNKVLALTSVFTRSNISCDATSSDVLVLGDSANANVVRQVIAPQVCVDITGALTTGNIQINCYHPYQRSADVNSSGYFTFTGSPYLAYTVQPGSSDAAGTVISCATRDTTGSGVGALARTLTTSMSRSGTSPNFTWTAVGWHTGSTGPVQTVMTRSGSTETVELGDNDGTVAMRRTRTYTAMLLDEEITGEQLGTTNAVTTSYTYNTASSTAPSYGWERLQTQNDGSWQGLEYGSNGTVQTVHTPWINASSSGFPADGGAHASMTFSADAFGQFTRPASSVTTIGGTTIAQSSTNYTVTTPFSAYSTSHPGLTVVQAVRADYASATGTLSSITKSFAENTGVPTPGNPTVPATDDFYRYLTHSIERPDKVKQSFVYQRGTWNGTTFTPSGNAGLDPTAADLTASRAVVITGSASSSAGTLCPAYSSYPVDTVYLVDKKSTLEVTIRNRYADIVRTETHVWLSGAWNLVSWVNYTYNLAHQLTDRTASNGAVYEASYSGERKSSETDESGITVSYTYDAAGRIDTVTRAAGGSIPALTTKFAYNAAGQVTQQIVGYGSSETLVSARVYDDAGRVTSESSPGPNGAITTGYSYNPGSRQVTVTLPNGGTRIELYQADGNPQQVTGSGVVPEYHPPADSPWLRTPWRARCRCCRWWPRSPSGPA